MVAGLFAENTNPHSGRINLILMKIFCTAIYFLFYFWKGWGWRGKRGGKMWKKEKGESQSHEEWSFVKLQPLFYPHQEWWLNIPSTLNSIPKFEMFATQIYTALICVMDGQELYTSLSEVYIGCRGFF